MTENDLAAVLGFTWDRSAVPRNVSGSDVRRAVWRFGKILPSYVWDAAEKPTSDLLNGLIANGEALEAGHFRGEGSVITQVSFNLGVAPLSREPGRGGQNLYDAAEIRAAKARMPGRGKRSLDAEPRET